MELYYDLHLHSCLSPCGHEEMTPANMAAMCALAGLQVVALTDHNTVGNCASFCAAAQRHGLLALSGMELTCAEEFHVVCLFPSLESAQIFGRQVAKRLPTVKNNPAIFGHQWQMDDGDEILGEEETMLAGATTIGAYEVVPMVERLGGIAYPAHIDRPSLSLLSTMGVWDSNMGFPLAELSYHAPQDLRDRPDLQGMGFVTGSDAHSLEEIRDGKHIMNLPQMRGKEVMHWLFHR